MRRSTPRWPVAVALALLLTIGIAQALAAPPGTGDRIRATLPQPGKALALPGTVHFVGQDTGKTFNVAVVRGARGAVLAYVCNGTSVGRWLTGRIEDGVADLTGPGGATLRARFLPKRVVGTARIGRTKIAFTLPRALRGSGLRRTLGTADGTRVEAAWIVTNTGVTRGLASESGGKTVATSSSSANPATDDDAGVSPPSGGSAPEPSPTLLRKFRCGRVVLGIAEIDGRFFNGTTRPTDAGDRKGLGGKFSSLDCEDFFAI